MSARPAPALVPAPRPAGDGAATRARVLGVAGAHLARLGARLTLSGVAREVGISHAALYRYHPSREALVDAVTGAWLRPLDEALARVAEGPDGAADKLERLVHAAARAYRDRLEEAPMAYEAFAAAALAARGPARRHRARLRAALERAVEQGQALGAFRAGDPAAGALLVLDLCHRFLDPLSVARDAAEPRAALRARLERALAAALGALGA